MKEAEINNISAFFYVKITLLVYSIKMIRNTGHADLPLHVGTVPRWLADRMMTIGTLIIESLVINFGVDEALVRLSDPLWFQSFGAVMGMDWHSSGITTSVMYALKRGLNARVDDLGIYICGGRGKYSRQTPNELIDFSMKKGMNGDVFVNNSKLCAKVDNNAVQDGFQLYQHNFIVAKTGSWAVVQQGMNVQTKTARRYHWCSNDLKSFVEEPHTGVVGDNQGFILNLTDKNAFETRNSILEITKDNPEKVINEIYSMSQENSEILLLNNGKVNNVEKHSSQGELFPELAVRNEIVQLGRNIELPSHHEVKKEDVDLKRLGGVLATAYENQPKDFESLMLTKGLGPRTLQSLTLVSEVIYGTPSRFTDPARYSFAHGGKDGQPFPVPLKIYDESIRVLRDSIEKSKLGYKDKSECIEKLHKTALSFEQNCNPIVDFDKVIEYERANSKKWDGKTVGS